MFSSLCFRGLAFFGALYIVLASPDVKMRLEQASQDVIFIEGTTTITTEITFNDVLTSDVSFDVYTSLDIPDFLMTNNARVKIGPNLHVTGNLQPTYDWGEQFAYPGTGYSANFNLGNVSMKVPPRGRLVPGNNTMLIQYDAFVPKERPDISEPGHIHTYGMIMQYGNGRILICENEAKFVERKSMPLLYQALSKTFPRARLPTKEMLGLQMKTKSGLPAHEMPELPAKQTAGLPMKETARQPVRQMEIKIDKPVRKNIKFI